MLRLWCVLALCAGCRANDLEWEIQFEPPELRDRVARLDARISRGPCPGTELVWDETVFPSRGSAELPELAEGTWCFAAQAGDTACNWIAEGSATADLPVEGGGPVIVTVSETAPAAGCAGTCTDGVCDGGGGTCSGTGMCDETCSAPPCSYTCSDGASCNFECLTGPCDIVCSGSSSCNVACTAGACNVTCEDSASCDVDCAAGSCDLTCQESATCDFDCTAGTCTFACLGTGPCTTSCITGSCT